MKQKINYLILVLMLALPALSWAQQSRLTKANWPAVIRDSFDCDRRDGKPFVEVESPLKYDREAGLLYVKLLNGINAGAHITPTSALASVDTTMKYGTPVQVLAFVGAITHRADGTPCLSFTDKAELIYAIPWKEIGGGWWLYLRVGCRNPDLVFAPSNMSVKPPCDTCCKTVINQFIFLGGFNLTLVKFDFNINLLDGYGGSAGFNYKGRVDTSGNSGGLTSTFNYKGRVDTSGNSGGLTSTTTFGDIIDKRRYKYKNKCCLPKYGMTRNFLYIGGGRIYGQKPFYSGPQYKIGWLMVSNKVRQGPNETLIKSAMGWSVGAEVWKGQKGNSPDSIPCSNCGHYNQARVNYSGVGITLRTGLYFDGRREYDEKERWFRVNGGLYARYTTPLGGVSPQWQGFGIDGEASLHVGPIRLRLMESFNPFLDPAKPTWTGGKFATTVEATVFFRISKTSDAPKSVKKVAKAAKSTDKGIWKGAVVPLVRGTWQGVQWGRGFKKKPVPIPEKKVVKPYLLPWEEGYEERPI